MNTTCDYCKSPIFDICRACSVNPQGRVISANGVILKETLR